jgi:hypothetical protein
VNNPKKKQEKLKIPLEFDKAVSSFLTVKPEPKKKPRRKLSKA